MPQLVFYKTEEEADAAVDRIAAKAQADGFGVRIEKEKQNPNGYSPKGINLKRTPWMLDVTTARAGSGVNFGPANDWTVVLIQPPASGSASTAN